MLIAAVNGILGALFAPACAACTRPLAEPLDGAVCADCWRAIERLRPPLCQICGDPIGPVTGEAICHECRRAPLPMRARAVGAYEGPLRQIVHAWKYDQRRTLAKPLAALAAEAGDELMVGVDVVVPVPLHWRRRWRRGFNQAEDLACRVGAAHGLPVRPVLRRTRSTRPQSDLDAHARRLNVRHAFTLAGRTPGRRAAVLRLVRKKVILLVDDVATTGATLSACAQVLVAAEAAEVRALTVARVVMAPFGRTREGVTGRVRRSP